MNKAVEAAIETLHEQSEPRLILTGNPYKGTTVLGPFPSYDAALDFIDNFDTGDDDWHIVKLMKPPVLPH